MRRRWQLVSRTCVLNGRSNVQFFFLAKIHCFLLKSTGKWCGNKLSHLKDERQGQKGRKTEWRLPRGWQTKKGWLISKLFFKLKELTPSGSEWNPSSWLPGCWDAFWQWRRHLFRIRFYSQRRNTWVCLCRRGILSSGLSCLQLRIALHGTYKSCSNIVWKWWLFRGPPSCFSHISVSNGCLLLVRNKWANHRARDPNLRDQTNTHPNGTEMRELACALFTKPERVCWENRPVRPMAAFQMNFLTDGKYI